MSSHDPIIFRRRIPVRDVDGQEREMLVQAVERDKPYQIALLFLTDDDYIRVNITKDMLSNELRRWMDGEIVSAPLLIASQVLVDKMHDFIRLGRPPAPSSMVVWILSRCQMYPSRDGSLLVQFGDNSAAGADNSTHNSSRADTSSSRRGRSDGSYAASRTRSASPEEHATERPHTTGELTRSRSREPHSVMEDATHTFELTEELLGKSQALADLKKAHLKNRSGAQTTVDKREWTPDLYRLTADIHRNREAVRQDMETRRRIIEVARIRQVQETERLRKISNSLRSAQAAQGWVGEANNEIESLRKIQEDIEVDTKRQRCRIERMKQHVFWTMAPNGFANRRGQSQRGPKLGDGPLPPTATSGLRDPRVDASVASYAWDIHGRRHPRGESRDAESTVELAMSAIRKAASNANLYKLDLRNVFDQIDVSGDGKITIDEMARAFELMGVQVDDDVLLVLFHHFDPNGSGSVLYGEFMWAFFNRRSLVRQWKTATKGMTNKQIELKFRQCDTSGNGKLNYREFKKVLASFQIKLSDSDTELLMNRFDSDGDGSLDLFEFTHFIQEEIEARNKGTEGQKTTSTPASTSDLAALFSKQREIEEKLAQLNIALDDKIES